MSKKEKIIDGFTETELNIINDFVNYGNRRASYRKHYKKTISDSAIYRFFRRQDVIDKIIELAEDLTIYDIVADKTLLNIISNPFSNDRDKINAIKVWNELRKRTFQTIKIENETKIDFSNVNDENLEAIVNKIMSIKNE